METTFNTDQTRRPSVAAAQTVAREFLMALCPMCSAWTSQRSFP